MEAVTAPQTPAEREADLLLEYDLVRIRAGYEAARAFLRDLTEEDFYIALKAISVRAAGQ